MRMIRGAAAISSIALLTTASTGVAQSFPDMTGYMYTYYADAAKTQLLGHISDIGCGETGGQVYVVRANVPTAYYDAEPIFTCRGGAIEVE